MFDLRSYWHHHGGIPLIGEMSLATKGLLSCASKSEPLGVRLPVRERKKLQKKIGLTKLKGLIWTDLAPPRGIEPRFSP